MARGLCILETDTGPKGALEYQIVVSAMKKFTGGPGDDDDLAEVRMRIAIYYIQDSFLRLILVCSFLMKRVKSKIQMRSGPVGNIILQVNTTKVKVQTLLY